MNRPGTGGLPHSYLAFRVLLTTLLLSALTGLVATAVRREVPAWLWGQATDLCRSVRDGLLP
ncbi:hypothetical protein [Jidongwangia harbinensis]|uniref:hypothetical protein n=1 Tax=Jidongwangia harbinensis TaxID=2878561 RepID=UPI001CD93D12|nr:hypothetical protein [Jidongwangia harbinensis]MCA2211636.1 hypothetical protein [Jidongwangia harbinensis]